MALYIRSNNRTGIITVKNAQPIEEDLFEYLLSKTNIYIGDNQNYGLKLSTLQKIFQRAYEGKVAPVMARHDLALIPLISSLDDMIKQIERC